MSYCESCGTETGRNQGPLCDYCYDEALSDDRYACHSCAVVIANGDTTHLTDAESDEVTRRLDRLAELFGYVTVDTDEADVDDFVCSGCGMSFYTSDYAFASETAHRIDFVR